MLVVTREKMIRYVVAESLATLLPAIMWKIENILHELGGLAEERSGQG